MRAPGQAHQLQSASLDSAENAWRRNGMMVVCALVIAGCPAFGGDSEPTDGGDEVAFNVPISPPADVLNNDPSQPSVIAPFSTDQTSDVNDVATPLGDADLLARVFVVESGTNSIIRLDVSPTLDVTSKFIASEDNGLGLPVDVEASDDGRFVYWTDAEFGILGKMDSAGGNVQILLSDRQAPSSIDIVGNDIVWGEIDGIYHAKLTAFGELVGEPLHVVPTESTPNAVAYNPASQNTYWSELNVPGFFIRAYEEQVGKHNIVDMEFSPPNIWWTDVNSDSLFLANPIALEPSAFSDLQPAPHYIGSSDDTLVYTNTEKGTVSIIPTRWVSSSSTIATGLDEPTSVTVITYIQP